VSTSTAFRTTLKELLEAAYDGKNPFVMGPRERPQVDDDLGCNGLHGKRPWAVDGNMEELVYGVWVLRYWVQPQESEEDDRNLQNLEDDAELLQLQLKTVLQEAGHDFFRVGSIEINYVDQYVEATLFAYQRNMGARGG
jgi:hypothetical protein